MPPDHAATRLLPSGGGGPLDPLTAGGGGALVLETEAKRGNEGTAAPTLGGVWPNPLRAGSDAAVTFTLGEAGPAVLGVFDVLGREVARPVDGPTETGHHTARLISSGLPAGTYLVRLDAGGRVVTQRLTILR